ncbi:MAG: HAD family hydrolase [Patescibacteria group bacterium]
MATAKVKVLAFDLMGVLYGQGHINHEYLMPFLKLKEADYPRIYQAYANYKLGKITKDKFWRLVGQKSTVEGKFLRTVKKSLDKDFLKLIKRLDPKYQFTVVTDLPESWAIALLQINYSFTFDYSIVSAWTGTRKDKSVTDFKKLIQKMKVKGEEILFIDDLLANLKNAGKLGIKTVWWPQDPNRPEQKVRYKPDYQIKKLSDILKIVK